MKKHMYVPVSATVCRVVSYILNNHQNQQATKYEQMHFTYFETNRLQGRDSTATAPGMTSSTHRLHVTRRAHHDFLQANTGPRDLLKVPIFPQFSSPIQGNLPGIAHHNREMSRIVIQHANFKDMNDHDMFLFWAPCSLNKQDQTSQSYIQQVFCLSATVLGKAIPCFCAPNLSTAQGSSGPFSNSGQPQCNRSQRGGQEHTV